MDRRRFIQGLTAAAASGTLVSPARAARRDVDVVIVGAGASGIAAGRYLTRYGYSVRLLEARKRLGGRAWASDNPFGTAFDYGCPQLDDVNVNLLARDARRAGIEFEDWVDEPSFYVKGRRSDKNDDAMETRLEELVDDIDDAGARQGDTALSRLSGRRSIGDAFALDIAGPLTYGLEPEDLSAQVLYGRLEGAGKARPKGGTVGGMLQSWGQKLPVLLNARVNRIVHDGDGVRVTGRFGTLRARAVIVTVPPVLLAREEIAFDPVLSPARMRALSMVKSGHIERCALSFDAGDLPHLEGKPLYLWKDRGPAVRIDLHTDSNVPMAVMTVGGDLAAGFAKEDLRAPLSLLREHLADLYGNDLRARGKNAVVTRWSGDAESLAAVQMPGVGSLAWNEVLQQSHGERIFFAGDAYDEDWPGRIAGAWASGRRAGKAVRQLVARKKRGK